VIADKPERLPWIDLARGFCIILVVMMHFDEIHYSNLRFADAPKSFWDAFTSLARPARMPTFYFISGFLASRSLYRPLRDVWDNRIGILVYTYLIWTFVSVSTLWLLFREFDAQAGVEFLVRLGGEIIFPHTQIWFLYGLVVFFTLARLLRDWPIPALAAAFAFSAISEWFDGVVISQMVRSLPYYLTGMYFPQVFLKISENAGWKRFVAIGLAYCATMVPLVTLEKTTAGIWIPATVVGVAAILTLARLVVDLPGARMFCFIGRNTLPIYVMHGSALIAFSALANSHIEALAELIGPVPFAYVYPIVGNAGLIAATIGVYFVLKWLGAGWLFTLLDSLRLESLDRRASRLLSRAEI
jgi:uncharacterized membrane protein YcfT